MASDSEKLTAQLVESFPLEAMKEKIANSTPEERAQIEEIKKGLRDNLKSGGIKGGLKYLNHIRPQL